MIEGDQRARASAGPKLCGSPSGHFRQGGAHFVGQRIRRAWLLTGLFNQMLSLEILHERIDRWVRLSHDIRNVSDSQRSRIQNNRKHFANMFGCSREAWRLSATGRLVVLGMLLTGHGDPKQSTAASFAALAAVGHLSVRDLNLNVAEYDPTIHYEQVKDKWFGLDTPDGR
jgi:hypothetical protein